MDKAHIEWSRSLFGHIADGGVWGVPRSGLLFKREGFTLKLIGIMPWEEGMPISAEELEAQQTIEYEDIKRHFEAAGVMVTKI
jgi:hypothetical protein